MPRDLCTIPEKYTLPSNIFREFFYIPEHWKLLFSTFPWVHIICKAGWPVLSVSSQGTGLFFNHIMNADGWHSTFLILFFHAIQQRQIQTSCILSANGSNDYLNMINLSKSPGTILVFMSPTVSHRQKFKWCLFQCVAIKVVCFTPLSSINTKTKQSSLVSEIRMGRGRFCFPTCCWWNLRGGVNPLIGYYGARERSKSLQST